MNINYIQAKFNEFNFFLAYMSIATRKKNIITFINLIKWENERNK